MKNPDYSEQDWQREQNQLEDLDRIKEKEEKHERFEVTLGAKSLYDSLLDLHTEKYKCLECFDTGIAGPGTYCAVCSKGADKQLELPFKGFDPKEPKGSKSIP